MLTRHKQQQLHGDLHVEWFAGGKRAIEQEVCGRINRQKREKWKLPDRQPVSQLGKSLADWLAGWLPVIMATTGLLVAYRAAPPKFWRFLLVLILSARCIGVAAAAADDLDNSIAAESSPDPSASPGANSDSNPNSNSNPDAGKYLSRFI